MDLHRPLDLNKLNEDFFSGKIDDIDTAEKTPDTKNTISMKETEGFNSVFTSIEESENFNSDLSLDEVKSILSNVNVQKSGVFHDLPEVKPSEESIDNSFPEIDLNSVSFDLPSEMSEKKEQKRIEKEKLKIEKENAEKEIGEEKKKLKEQKTLERSVQKPFRKRRVCVGLFVFLLLADMLVSAFSFLVSKTDANYIEPMELFGYNVNFVDGVIIDGKEYNDSIILYKTTTIQGNQTILFLSDSLKGIIGEIIAIGDNIYAVDLKTSVTKIGADRILGVINFSIPNTNNILTLIRANANYLMIACISFAVVVLIAFSLRIASLNKKIKRLKESYELI